MTRRGHGFLAALIAAGTAIALFQAWYVYLPLEEAARFDLCQINEHVDCFRSLARFGLDMTPFGIPVFASLAGIFLFQLALCLFALALAEPRRGAWLALAGLAAFPAAGLCLYVLLHDLLVAKVTSPSALLIAAAALALCVLAVRSGLPRGGIRAGLGGAFLLAAGAALASYALHVGGIARLEVANVEREREARPPSVRWPRFAQEMPRTGAAHMGGLLADTEILLFVDPAQEESRALLKDLADLGLGDGSPLLIYVYGQGSFGAALLEAEKQDRVAALLADPAGALGQTVRSPLLDRQDHAARALGVDSYPTALWKGGKRTGIFRLRDIIAAASPP